jgi:hypothetical protein
MDTDNHLAHGPGINGLVHNLQNLPQEWAGALFTGAYEPARLGAIARQADNIKEQALTGIETVGQLQALAAGRGALPDEAIRGAGWLVAFLAELASCMDVLGANATHTREHGPLT